MACPTIRFTPQLTGVPQGSANCGPATTCMMVDFASCGLLRTTPLDIRRRMGDMIGATQLSDMERAIESFDDEARHVGLKDLTATIHYHRPWAEFIDSISNPAVMVGLVIDYGTVNQIAHRRSGDKSFYGDHILGATGIRGTGANRQTRVYDPLSDGRRKGIPSYGPHWWPLEILREAAGDEAGHGMASWISTHRSSFISTIQINGSAGEGVRKEDAIV